MISKSLTILCVAAAVLLSADSPWWPPESVFEAASATGDAVPAVLSGSDRALYHQIFDAQKKADWQTADALIPRLSDKLLLGHVLAERYLSRQYHAKPAELAAWLDKYSDHPQAFDISMLAGEAPSHKPQFLQGYGADNGLGHSNDTGFAQQWKLSLQCWRAGDKVQAAKLFAALADGKTLSPWQKSAASYWAYRALAATDESADATKYLRLAAHETHSFYGILANKRLGRALKLDATPVQLTDSDMLEMIGEPAVRRAVALTHTGLGELAEKELRAAFPAADDEEKLRLMALSHELHLASAELSMAQQLSRDGRALDFARYPIPNWKPADGFTVDPALIYALARQESGFHTGAVSAGGALGVMQLMPKTASLIQKRSSLSGNANEPVMNVTLGQNYVEQLLDNDMVDGNLLYMLTAYNAGAGRLQNWKQTIDDQNDPLLFLESIPYGETRHYVTQVMANYWIYSELAGRPNASVSALLAGKWPSYDRHLAALDLGRNG